MAARSLPTRPNLEQYKKQAKDLVKAWKAGGPDAIARIRAHHDRARMTLTDAQFVIAREHGFDSWPTFAAHLHSLTPEGSPREIWRRAERAIVDGDEPSLEALLREHGDLLRTGPVVSSWLGGLAPDYRDGDARVIIAKEHFVESWEQFARLAAAMKDPASAISWFETAVDAVIAGDEGTLERQLRADPELIRARSTRTHHSTLLHYVGANGVEGFRQRTPKNAVRIAEILLDAGADIDATADMYGGGQTTLGLVATSIHPANAGVQEDLMTVLLARGASVGGTTGIDAWSRLISACHANGRPQAAEFLAERAPGLDLEAAAGVGRLDVVRGFFTADGELRDTSTAKQMTDGFAWACEYGRTPVVAFLIQRGVDVGTKLRNHGQTGLHWAAFGGYPDTVRILLNARSPVNEKDPEFDGTPLGWALYAWGGGGPRPGSELYYDVVAQLVAAGATVDPQWLDASSRGFPLARRIQDDPRMRAALGHQRSASY